MRELNELKTFLSMREQQRSLRLINMIRDHCGGTHIFEHINWDNSMVRNVMEQSIK